MQEVKGRFVVNETPDVYAPAALESRRARLGNEGEPLKNNVLSAARSGLYVWMVYGILEFLLSIVAPRVLTPDLEILPWQWPLAGSILAVYAVVGVLLGIAGSVLTTWTGRSSPEAHKIWANLTLVLAFALNLSRAWPLARAEQMAMAVAILLATIFASAMVSGVWRVRVAPLVNPWISSLLFLIVPWVTREVLHDSSNWMKMLISAVALAAIMILAVSWRRIFDWKLVHRHKTITVAASIVVCAVWFGARISGSTQPIPAPGSPPAAAKKPNVLLIVMDTVRADHVSVYGYERETTPFLREFAREATVYERAIACDGFTLPTHASMFTGVYPSWHGATVRSTYPYGSSLSPRRQTLASVLRANGYFTAEAVANYGYLGPAMGLAQGFTSAQARRAVPLSDSTRPSYLRESVKKFLSAAFNTTAFDQFRLLATDINRHALGTIEENRDRNAPFFIFLNYMDAHIPYIPPAPFRTRFNGSDRNVKPRLDETYEGYQALRDEVNSEKRSLDENEKRYMISQYDAGIAFMDSAIGTLMKRLRELGLYDNTLVIITSDHGEAFGEHNRREHGISSVYQDQVHVPLLVKYPGQHEGHRSDALVSQVDFMPTVLEVSGIAAPPGLQGQSFRSPRSEESSAIFSESSAVGYQQAYPRLRGARRAVFSGNLKLTVWTAGDPEFYDLAADPGELNNQYRPDDPRAAALLARVNAWIAAMPRLPAQSKSIDKSTLEKMRSLGYVQ
jgi:arylsulfatase A-like enzyme